MIFIDFWSIYIFLIFIGFNLAVLLTNLDEHITNDKRLKKILDTAKNMLDYFDKYLGRIEIMGSSKRVEKVYFEIKDDWLEQWNQPQIKVRLLYLSIKSMWMRKCFYLAIEKRLLIQRHARRWRRSGKIGIIRQFLRGYHF